MSLLIKKIISGAQTGADRAGLDAAIRLGIITGGTMPKGFIALDGNHPEFAVRYGIVEHPSSSYPPRTAANVRDSDGTVRFAYNWNSYGELCTQKMINKYNRPQFDVDISDPPDPSELRAWIGYHNIKILNVAGNADGTNSSGPIYEFVLMYLIEALGDV